MVSTESRLTDWVGIVSDLLREPLTEFPSTVVCTHLWRTFGAEPSHNRVQADGTVRFEMLHPLEDWPPVSVRQSWRDGGMQRDPLLRWYALTRSTAPQSMARVPGSVAPRADLEETRSYLRPIGVDQLLCLPYRLTAPSVRLFVLGRWFRDFSDDDLELAHRIQPLICLLDRQVSVLAETTPLDPREADGAGLTGRELAVLRLLALGCTAEAIGRRLGCAPRTVHKHLEHLYRKLHVSDRLSAVRVGEAGGLVPTPRSTVPAPRPPTQKYASTDARATTTMEGT